MVTGNWLFIDNSNTRTKFALGDAGKLSDWKRIVPTSGVTETRLAALLASVDFEAVVICSVVPTIREVLAEYFGKFHAKIPVHILNHLSPIGLEIDYPEPAQVGADRLANAAAIAGNSRFPAIVIDFGTAVTFDVISSRPAYCGGVIAPGLGAMTDYLAEKTALLPVIDLKVPEKAIGTSTVEAMRAGAYHGYRGLVREILAALRAELDAAPHVIATGGDAEWITREMSEIHEVSESLTLEGIRKVAVRVFG